MCISMKLKCLSILLVFHWIFLSARPWALAGDPGGETRARTETAVLRQRIANLEEQNAIIHRQLVEIQKRLDLSPLRESNGAPAKANGQVIPVSSLTLSSSEIVAKQTETIQTAAATAPAAPPSSSAAAASPAPQNAPPDRLAVRTEGNQSEVSFYGFVRVDAIFDDSRPSAFQTPTFIRSEGPDMENRSNFAFHPRLTRMGLNYRGLLLDGLGGSRITGKIETDFQNGGRESRAVARYRHAYLQLGWEDSSLLVGQTWDIISPLYPTVNADTLMWNAGNLGDRRVQMRYTYEPQTGLSLRAGLGLTGAVDNQDVDGNGVRDGEASTLPNLQGRIGYHSSGGTVRAGLWGHYAQLETDALFGGVKDFDSYSFGGDYEFRFHPAVSLKGELWTGSNLSDFRGGIGQSFNTVTGEEIGSRGGWVELGLRASRYSFSTGYTIDDPENGDLLDGSRTKNRAWYVTNQFRLAPPVLLGLDYLYWKTNFKGREGGIDNRVNLYLIYNF